MRFVRLNALCVLASISVCAAAQNITGTVLIKKRLSHPSVTPAVSVYQRGTAVRLGKDDEEDPLVFERSRVVLYLEGPNPASDAATEQAPARVEQLDRRFSPDLVVVASGSTVSFPNMDPIFHDVFSLSRAKSFDLGAYDKGETRRVEFTKPGIVDVYCHLHPNMTATIVVTPNRWNARPDRDGQYHIDEVPPGQYTLVAWHKTAGFFRKPVVVSEGRDVAVDFFIPLDMDSK